MSRIIRCSLGIIASLLWVVASLRADPPDPPAWWTDTTNGTAILNGNTSNNYAPLNLGQLKNTAAQAKVYLDLQLSAVGGAGPVINALVNSFSTNATLNKAPVLMGQLKYVAQPFYDRLQAAGYNTESNLNARITGGWSHIYPWPDPPARPNHAGYNADDYKAWLKQQFVPANLGQLKLVFSFDLTGFTPTGGNITGNMGGNASVGDSGTFLGRVLTSPWVQPDPPDDLPDAFWDWADEAGLNTADPNLATEDPDGDHLTNYQEWIRRTDPNNADTDGDGVQDNLDAIPLNANFTMATAAVPDYSAFHIAQGRLTDMNKKGEVLIDQTTRDIYGNITSGHMYLWNSKLLTLPDDYETTYFGYSVSSTIQWMRIDDSGSVLGYIYGDNESPLYWHPGMDVPMINGNVSSFFYASDPDYEGFNFTFYGDSLGNIYMYGYNFGAGMPFVVWHSKDGNLEYLGDIADGPVDIPLAKIKDSSGTPHTLTLEYYIGEDSSEHNSLYIDGVDMGDDVDDDTASLVAYSHQFAAWAPHAVLGGNITGANSLVYASGGSSTSAYLVGEDLFVALSFTSLNQLGYATTSDGMLWVNSLTQTITDNNGTPLFLDMVSADGKFALGHYGNSSTMTNSTQLVLLQVVPDLGPEPPASMTFSATEFSGATHRKIALNGRPLPDGKPQTAPESDHQPEETFVDALTQSLRHNVTDLYSTVAGTDLPLSVNRVYGEEIWCTDHGLQPTAHPDWPFGPGWRSNLAPSITIEDTGNTTVDAYVTDEDGDEYHFIGGNVTVGNTTSFHFVPYPASRHEKKTYLATLTLTGNTSGLEGNATLILQKKYGTTVAYDYTKNITQNINTEIDDSPQETFRFYRADYAQDRMGNQLRYGYGNSTTLLPGNLAMHDVSGNLIPGATVNVTYVSSGGPDNGLVHNITDSDGKTTTYTYGNFTDDAEQITAKLVNVQDAAGGNVSYGYQLSEEDDTTPHGPDYEGPFPIYDHLELANITDQNGHEYQFASALSYDTYWTKGFMNLDEYGYYPASGRPRLITQVTLPDGSHSSFDGDILLKTFGGYGAFVLSNDSHRVLNVTDADGRHLTYTWSNAQVVPLDVPYALQAEEPNAEPCVVLYTTMTVDYGNTYGQETFNFSPEAGMALLSATDLGGATTTYAYDDAWAAPSWYSKMLPSTADITGYFDDPTAQTDADGGTKIFKYSPANTTLRLMSDVVDQNGHLTHYDFNSNGLRIAEQHYDGSDTNSTLVAETDFAYTNTTFPGVMTQRSAIKLGGDPSWAANLTVNYTLNNAGRIESEVVDPGNLSLATNHTYSNTGDLLSTTDPRGNVTTFGYDDRHRLLSTTYPGSVSRNFTYDGRGNVLTETDELGHATVNKYNELNELVSTTRVLTGDASNITAGLATAYTYNHTGARLSMVSPNGVAVAANGTVTGTDANYTTTFAYDDLNRMTEMHSPPVSVDGGNATPQVTTYAYDGTNPGGSVFDSSSFKPTSVTDPRGYASLYAYNGRGLLTDESVQYELDDGNGTANYTYVQNTYDPAGNLLEKDVDLSASSVASYAADWQNTTYAYDALNRLVTTTHASDNSTIVANYTSTGLAYLRTDELGRQTGTEYDAAGRATKTLLADPATGLLTGNYSNITTGYDANGNALNITDALGNVTSYTYDARNRRITTTMPSVADWGNGGTSTAPVLNTYYDDAGNPYRTTDALGHDTYLEYDAANRLVWTFTPAVDYWNGTGNVTGVYLATKREYDGNGNVLEIRQGYATTQSSANATLTRNTTVNTYDFTNHLASTTDAANVTVSYGYDEVGNRLLVSDGLAHNTTYTYDGLNRVLDLHPPVGNDTVYTYGPTHMLTMEVVETGISHDYHYDLRDRMIADSGFHFAYDNAGELLLSGTDDYTRMNDSFVPYSPSYAYAYDGRGRVVAENQGGFDGNYSLYPGDDLDPTTFGSLSSNITGGHGITYAYDANGNRLSAAYYAGEAGNWTVNTGYDALNRVSNVTEVVTGGNRTTSYHYDLAGRRLELLQANSGNIWTTYDNLGRATAITGNRTSGNTTTTRYAYALAYDLYNNLARQAETYPNGSLSVAGRTLTLSYDEADRLTQEQAVTPTTTTTGSNGTAHWTSNFTSTYTSNFTYDAGENRLTNLTVNSTLNSTATTINATNVTTTNNTTTNTTAANLTCHYDAANELNWYHDTVGNLTANFTYDGMGRRVQETRNGGNYTSYTYDGWGRLTWMWAHLTGETGSDDLIYQYVRDYRGRAVAREEVQYNPPGTNNFSQLLDTVYLYDGDSPVRRQLQAYDETGVDPDPIGSPSNLTYLRGPDQGGGIGGILYSVQPSGNTTVQHYFGYDGRGDVVAQTDSNGNLTYQAAYNAYGLHSAATPTKGTFIQQAAPGTQEWTASGTQEWTASGAKTDRLRMNTKEEDPVGLVNQGQRYYMPELGVFVNEDPLGDVDGSNRFTYVRNNPATHIDAEGLWLMDNVPWWFKPVIPYPIQALDSRIDNTREAFGVYHLARQTGSNPVSAYLQAGATSTLRSTGAMDWAESRQGEKIATDAHGQVSTKPIDNMPEEISKAISGSVGMVFTALGGAQVASSINAANKAASAQVTPSATTPTSPAAAPSPAPVADTPPAPAAAPANPITAKPGQMQTIDPNSVLAGNQQALDAGRIAAQRQLIQSGTPRALGPPEVSTQGVILDGHHNLRAASDLGKSVDVKVVDVPVTSATKKPVKDLPTYGN